MVLSRRYIVLAMPLLLSATFFINMNMTNQIQKAALSPFDQDKAVSPHYMEPQKLGNTSQLWSLEVSDRGAGIDCNISTQQIKQSEKMALDLKNKIVIHIHGMHHSGTGYLRQTMLNALNYKFSPSNNRTGFQNSSSALEPVACIHDSLLPFRHMYKNKTELYINHHKAEEEGQHLQTIYPPIFTRAKLIQEAKGQLMGKAPTIAYLADYCVCEDDTDNKRIGNNLFGQWMRYWNVTSSTRFLLQKSPSLDVKFLESTKISPTLHVILMRHPMTSNSWEQPNMSYWWAMAYHHVMKLLNIGGVEWYAVVTYEALLEYHDEVVEELVEVVRSGIERHRLTDNFHLKRGNYRKSKFRRRLHLHDGNRINNPKKRDNLWLGVQSNSYLIPKKKSVEKWRLCLERSQCRQVLADLTTDILPLFGYVSVKKSDFSLVKRINDSNSTTSTNVPLTINPSPVTVSKQFGRVLFSSEGDALKVLRKMKGSLMNEKDEIEYIGQPPPMHMVEKIAKLLDDFASKPNLTQADTVAEPNH